MTGVADSLRSAPLSCVLHALARGETSSEALTRACLDAIGRDNERIRAWWHVDAASALRNARASDARRAKGAALGRLDGVPVAVKDNFDVAGMPTSLGLPRVGDQTAGQDAAAVSRLRGAGAVVLGKTALDEAAFGTMGRNPHYGTVANPRFPGRACGGSSAGSAAAVAAGHVVAALGSDTLGSVRIPAAFCGLVGLRPTYGEVSRTGLATALRRLDAPGVLCRDVSDAAVLLHVLSGYDPEDPATRARRVPFAAPDWDPSALRVGVVADLEALGATAAVVETFRAALDAAGPSLGHARPVSLDLAPLEIAASRRAALLLMEAELVAAHGPDLGQASAALKAMLDFARRKSAVDAVNADRRLDAHVVAVRRLLVEHDVLLLPTVPMPAPAADAPEPPNLADFTALASLAGCPALSLPLANGQGLQLVGARGSDLRLLEFGEILLAVIGAVDD